MLFTYWAENIILSCLYINPVRSGNSYYVHFTDEEAEDQ